MTRRKWSICPDCDGEGMIVHPALSVWTQEDRYEDPDGFESMMEGDYDVPCIRCSGTGKVTLDTEEDFHEDLEDAKIRGMESGDPELYYNPRLGLA